MRFNLSEVAIFAESSMNSDEAIGDPGGPKSPVAIFAESSMNSDDATQVTSKQPDAGRNLCRVKHELGPRIRTKHLFHRCTVAIFAESSMNSDPLWRRWWRSRKPAETK